jgi:hypothetical protein
MFNSMKLAMVVIGVVATGCYSSVSSTSPRRVRDVDPATVQGPYVPAGARFSVRMNDQIDTLHSTPGQPFTGTVEVALTSPDGQVVVPAGAAIRGHVASIGSPSAPRVRLDFESVDTVNGPARIEARVKDASYQAYLGPPVFVPAPVYDYSDAWGFGYAGPGYPMGGYGIRPFGGGPYYGELYEPVQPREIRITPNSRLELQLTRPLLPPGARVVSPR